MTTEEKEIYELLALMPIDTKRMNILNDITYEAQLLMRSKFSRTISMRFDDLLKIHEYAKDKEALFTTEIDHKRFVIYIDKGKIVSSVMSDPEKGERIVGLKPLATLLMISKEKPLTFKIFEIQPISEEIDKTIETPRKIRRQGIEKTEVAERKTAIEKKATVIRTIKKREEKPIILEFARKLKEFIDQVKEEINESAPLYGCKPVDTKVTISRGVITVRVIVKKKSLFSRCNHKKLKEVLNSNVGVIMSMLDLNLPYRVIVELTK
ncbi:MAG: hypothetical protein J7J82_06780 [Staphylothermus sp.]|nr:hypothetical protein [Staphylothermus sp.]